MNLGTSWSAPDRALRCMPRVEGSTNEFWERFCHVPKEQMASVELPRWRGPGLPSVSSPYAKPKLTSRAGSTRPTRPGAQASRRGDTECLHVDNDVVSSSAPALVRILVGAGLDEQANVEPLVLPPRYAAESDGLSGDVGANVIRDYAAIAADLRRGSCLAPDFAHALRRHRLLAAARPVDALSTGAPASSAPARSA